MDEERTGDGAAAAGVTASAPTRTTPGTWLATALVIVTTCALLWVVLAGPFRSPIPCGPPQRGEVVVIRVVGGRQIDHSGVYDHELRMPDGKVAVAEFREVLPRGEHLRATYSYAPGGRLLKLDAFVRCGPGPCGTRH